MKKGERMVTDRSNEPYYELGTLVKKYRKRHGLTQETLTQAICERTTTWDKGKGITRTSICKLETGRIRIAQHYIELLADICNVSAPERALLLKHANYPYKEFHLRRPNESTRSLEIDESLKLEVKISSEIERQMFQSFVNKFMHDGYYIQSCDILIDENNVSTINLVRKIYL